MTKERIEKELLKVREQLAGLQARQKDLEEQLQICHERELCSECSCGGYRARKQL